VRKSTWIVLIALAGVAGLWYALTPEGPLGYDEGTRLVDHTISAARDLNRSGDYASTFLYTPKYGNDQRIHVEFTRGDYCPSTGPNCQGTTVVVGVTKGKPGAGYALAGSVAVPHHLSIDKREGPIEVGLAKQSGVIQVVSLR